MAALRDELAPVALTTSDALGLPAQAKEAYAFALLGFLTHHGRRGRRSPSATGARHASRARLDHTGFGFATRSPGSASPMIRKIGLTALVCASLTPATAQADTFKTVPTKGLTWTKHGVDAAAYARLDELAKTFPRRDLTFVLGHPRQTTQSAAGSPSLGQVGPGAVSSFKWSDRDNDGAWIPQGITGSAAATDDGLIDGHRALLVSWYKKIDVQPRARELRQRRQPGRRRRDLQQRHARDPERPHRPPDQVARGRHRLVRALPVRRRDGRRRARVRHELHPRRRRSSRRRRTSTRPTCSRRSATTSRPRARS